MSSANKKYSGYTGVSKANTGGASITTRIEGDNNEVSLFASDELTPYVDVLLLPTRDGKNVFLFTWNYATHPELNLFKIYRIISSGLATAINTSAQPSDDPSNILIGAGTIAKCDEVTLEQGDLYREYINADEFSGQYVTILIISTYEDYANYRAKYMLLPIQNMCIANAPSLSFNSSTGYLTIGTAMAGRRIIEFYRRDRNYGYPSNISDVETLNEFLLTTLINIEGRGFDTYGAYFTGVLSSYITKWAKGSYTIGVQFNGTQNRTKISNAINNAITQINNVLNDYGVYFIRSGTSGDITITVDSEYNLFGIDLDTAGYVYGGTWETVTDGYGYITSANIKLANDYYESAPFVSYETAALEELAQSMGAGYDQIEYPYDTLHTDFNYLNKQSLLTTKDKNILRLLYSDYVSAGDTCVMASQNLNLPKGVYCVSTSETDRQWTVQCPFFEPGASYSIRAWIVNFNGYMTYTSDWMNVTVPGVDEPTGLSFTSRVNGGATFSWNAAPVADGYEIQAVRNYDGYISFDQTVYGTQKAISSLSAGTTYTIKVRTFTSIYGNKQYSDWVSIQFTTNPSRPVLNLISTKNGAIEIDWTLEDTTSDYTYIWINIYETADATEPLVGTTIESGSGKSGHVTLIIPSEEWAISDGETFYLRAQVMYYDEYVSGQNLKCLTDSGAEYTLTLYIVVSSRPDKFEWDTPKVGKNFKITTGEVNRLHENINAVRQYMKDYVSGSTEYSFTYVTVGMTFSAGLYNAWVSAIKGISGFGTYINYVSVGDRITADLLNAVVNELNSVEKEGLS